MAHTSFRFQLQENKIRAITFITGRGRRPGRFESRSKLQRPHLIPLLFVSSARRHSIPPSHHPTILPVLSFLLFSNFLFPLLQLNGQPHLHDFYPERLPDGPAITTTNTVQQEDRERECVCILALIINSNRVTTPRSLTHTHPHSASQVLTSLPRHSSRPPGTTDYARVSQLFGIPRPGLHAHEVNVLSRTLRHAYILEPIGLTPLIP